MRASFRPAVLLATFAAACAPERALAPPDADAPRASVAPAAPTRCPAACERAEARARARLERAADGLTYTSESDFPFEFVSAAAPRSDGAGARGARGALDEPALRAAFGIASAEPVEVVALDDFFRRHTEPADPTDRAARALAPRYRALARTVRAVTGTTRVYRVGRIAVRCYLVGTDAWGNVVGLATTAIET